MICRLTAISSFFLLALTLASCGEEKSAPFDGKDLKSVVKLRCTPVKNQGASQTCWIYAMVACIETDRLAMGDSLILSEQWVIDQMHREHQTEMHIADYSRLRKRIGIIDRNIGPEALRLIENYGIVPSWIRPGRNGGFYLYSMHYTPRQFAESVVSRSDWHWYATSTLHEMGTKFILEVPDNVRQHEVENVPMDSIISFTVNSLMHRHPVYWGGAFGDNAIMADKADGSHPIKGTLMTPQRPYPSDNHALAIVGLSRDSKGNRYFLMKNSWGKKWGNNGYCYMSEEQLRKSTVIVGVKR